MKNVLMLFFLYFFIVKTVYGGLVIEQEVAFKEQGKEANVVKRFVYISGDKMRTDYPENGRYNIILLNDKIIWDVDENAQRYQEVNFGKGIKKELEKQSKDPFPGAAEESITITQEDDTRDVSGYPCRLFIVKQPGNIVTKVWISENVPGRDEFYSFYRKFAELSKGVKALEDISVLTSRLESLNGMPIEMEVIEPEKFGLVSAVTTTKSVTQKEISKDLFRLTKNLKKIR